MAPHPTAAPAPRRQASKGAVLLALALLLRLRRIWQRIVHLCRSGLRRRIDSNPEQHRKHKTTSESQEHFRMNDHI